MFQPVSFVEHFILFAAHVFHSLFASWSVWVFNACPCGQVCSYPLITLGFFLWGGVFGSLVPLGRASLACLGMSLFRLAPCACALLVWLPFPTGLRAGLTTSGFRCYLTCRQFCMMVTIHLFVAIALVALVLAVWPCSRPVRKKNLPPWLSPGVFWSSQCSAGFPPSGYLVVSATVRLSYPWYGVSWLIGSCLHSAPWQQRLRPCVGLLPSTPCCGCCSCAPRSVTEVFALVWSQFTLRTPLKLHTPAFLACAAFSLLSLLPSRASALSFLAGLRLSPSPRALVLLGFVCPPCGPLSWLVLVAPPSVCFWFVLLAWPDFCFVWFVWCFVVLFVPGWFLCFVFCFWWLLLTSYWTGTLVYFAFTCTN